VRIHTILLIPHQRCPRSAIVHKMRHFRTLASPVQNHIIHPHEHSQHQHQTTQYNQRDVTVAQRVIIVPAGVTREGVRCVQYRPVLVVKPHGHVLFRDNDAAEAADSAVNAYFHAIVVDLRGNIGVGQEVLERVRGGAVHFWG